MNCKELSKRMNRRNPYKWVLDTSNCYALVGQAGKTLYKTDEHLTAEIVAKKLRGMGFNIVGEVPSNINLRD